SRREYIGPHRIDLGPQQRTIGRKRHLLRSLAQDHQPPHSRAQRHRLRLARQSPFDVQFPIFPHRPRCPTLLVHRQYLLVVIDRPSTLQLPSLLFFPLHGRRKHSPLQFLPAPHAILPPPPPCSAQGVCFPSRRFPHPRQE